MGTALTLVTSVGKGSFIGKRLGTQVSGSLGFMTSPRAQGKSWSHRRGPRKEPEEQTGCDSHRNELLLRSSFLRDAL